MEGLFFVGAPVELPVLSVQEKKEEFFVCREESGVVERGFPTFRVESGLVTRGFPRYFPIRELGFSLSSSGVPDAMTSPPVFRHPVLASVFFSGF